MIFGAPPRASTGSLRATIAIAKGATASASFKVFFTFGMLTASEAS